MGVERARVGGVPNRSRRIAVAEVDGRAEGMMGPAADAGDLVAEPVSAAQLQLDRALGDAERRDPLGAIASERELEAASARADLGPGHRGPVAQHGAAAGPAHPELGGRRIEAHPVICQLQRPAQRIAAALLAAEGWLRLVEEIGVFVDVGAAGAAQLDGRAAVAVGGRHPDEADGIAALVAHRAGEGAEARRGGVAAQGHRAGRQVAGEILGGGDELDARLGDGAGGQLRRPAGSAALHRQGRIAEADGQLLEVVFLHGPAQRAGSGGGPPGALVDDIAGAVDGDHRGQLVDLEGALDAALVARRIHGRRGDGDRPVDQRAQRGAGDVVGGVAVFFGEVGEVGAYRVAGVVAGRDAHGEISADEHPLYGRGLPGDGRRQPIDRLEAGVAEQVRVVVAAEAVEQEPGVLGAQGGLVPLRRKGARADVRGGSLGEQGAQRVHVEAAGGAAIAERAGARLHRAGGAGQALAQLQAAAGGEVVVVVAVEQGVAEIFLQGPGEGGEVDSLRGGFGVRAGVVRQHRQAAEDERGAHFIRRADRRQAHVGGEDVLPIDAAQVGVQVLVGLSKHAGAVRREGGLVAKARFDQRVNGGDGDGVAAVFEQLEPVEGAKLGGGIPLDLHPGDRVYEGASHDSKEQGSSVKVGGERLEEALLIGLEVAQMAEHPGGLIAE